MTSLAPHLSGFLREHLPKERRALYFLPIDFDMNRHPLCENL
jgi:hypothetical protein